MVDAEGIVRAGNGVYEQAQALGLPVRVVETDGKELIAVQRTDLRGKDAIRAAALDNIAGDSSSYDYDAAILAEIARDDAVIAALAKEDARLAAVLEMSNPPTLDDLEKQYGEPDERDFWPVIRVQVSPETRERFDSIWKDITGEDDAAKFAKLLGAVDCAALSGGD